MARSKQSQTSTTTYVLSFLVCILLLYDFQQHSCFFVAHTESQAPESQDTEDVQEEASNQWHGETSSSKICLTMACVSSEANKLARAFPEKSDKSSWIINDSSDHKLERFSAGILLTKNPKAASSTTAGIALRIAHRYETEWVEHAHRLGSNFANHDPTRTLLFSSVRDPASRAISRVFFTVVSRNGRKPSDENVLKGLQVTDKQYGAVSHVGGGFQVFYLTLEESPPKSWENQSPTTVIDPEQVRQLVKDIIQTYDFLFVAERMDESTVAFALLTGLSLGDVLVQDAKRSEGLSYAYFRSGEKEKCARSISSFRSPVVQNYLQSPRWMAQNYGDYLLHMAANKSLDLTIEQLGPTKFQQSLQEYKSLKKTVQILCANQTLSRCTDDGQVQKTGSNCYHKDHGCGYACVDEVLSSKSGTTFAQE